MIVCCGDALIDMLPGRMEAGGDGFLPVVGGAILNTAVGLGRLGVPAGFISGISTDFFGQKIISHLKASGVDTGMCIRSGQPTTLAFVNLENGQADYVFYDQLSAARAIRPEQVRELPGKVKALHVGAISLVPDDSGSIYENLVKAGAPSRVISFDPNIRPAFVSDVPAYRSRLARLIGLSDVIKVSDEDFDWLCPGRDIESVVQEWLAAGVKVVLYTRGADGVSAHTRSLCVTRPAAATSVVDTVGAGDAFNAGFLTGLHMLDLLSKPALENISVERLSTCLELAVRSATHVVSRVGADPPWRSDLNLEDVL